MTISYIYIYNNPLFDESYFKVGTTTNLHNRLFSYESYYYKRGDFIRIYTVP